MPVLWTVLIILALAVTGYVLGQRRALAAVGNDARKLHSRPNYYGWNVALYTAIPALMVLLVWLLAQPLVIDRATSAYIPEDSIGEGQTMGTMMSEVRTVAGKIADAERQGVITSAEADSLTPASADVLDKMKQADLAVLTTPVVMQAAVAYRDYNATARLVLTSLMLVLSLGGMIFALSRTTPEFRARNVVEQVIRGLLILSSTIAILTTVGIVLSLVFESINFFRMYPWQSFFFGLEWTPSFQGNSKLGVLPLLWGTLYISLIALLVAVPIGLFAAIYMSEYASPRVRCHSYR